MRPGFCRELLTHEVVKIFQLRESGAPYASAYSGHRAAFKFGFKQPGQYSRMRQIVGRGIF